MVLDYEIVEYEEIITAFGIDPKRFSTLRDLIRNHSIIKAKSAEILQTKKDGLVTLIAQKIGASPSDDIRPTTIATVLEFAYSSAYDIWKEREAGVAFYDILDEVFALVEEGMNYPCVA